MISEDFTVVVGRRYYLVCINLCVGVLIDHITFPLWNMQIILPYDDIEEVNKYEHLCWFSVIHCAYICHPKASTGSIWVEKTLNSIH